MAYRLSGCACQFLFLVMSLSGCRLLTLEASRQPYRLEELPSLSDSPFRAPWHWAIKSRNRWVTSWQESICRKCTTEEIKLPGHDRFLFLAPHVYVRAATR
jgi:hypothetical protein